jgi:hypothetical protein
MPTSQNLPMGKLKFESQTSRLTSAQMTIIEEEMSSLIQGNKRSKLFLGIFGYPKSKELVEQATDKRDIQVVFKDNIGLTQIFGAHWEKKTNSVVIAVSNLDFPSDEKALRKFIGENHEKLLYPLIFELANAVNPQLNTDSGLKMIDFEDADSWAYHAEKKEFLTFQRVAQIVNNGIRFHGWNLNKMPEFTLDEYDEYYHTLADSEKTNYHAYYYKNQFKQMKLVYPMLHSSIVTKMQGIEFTFEFDGYSRNNLLDKTKQEIERFYGHMLLDFDASSFELLRVKGKIQAFKQSLLKIGDELNTQNDKTIENLQDIRIDVLTHLWQATDEQKAHKGNIIALIDEQIIALKQKNRQIDGFFRDYIESATDELIKDITQKFDELESAPVKSDEIRLSGSASIQFFQPEAASSDEKAQAIQQTCVS